MDCYKSVLIKFYEGADLDKGHETLQDLGLYESKILRAISVIVGKIHPHMLETICKVSDVDYIDIAEERRISQRRGSYKKITIR